MKDETAMSVMQRQEAYDPRFAQQRREDYRREIQPWVQLYCSMVPMGGFSIRQNADGTLEERTEHWSQEQQNQIDMIRGEISKVGERYGLTAAPEVKP